MNFEEPFPLYWHYYFRLIKRVHIYPSTLFSNKNLVCLEFYEEKIDAPAIPIGAYSNNVVRFIPPILKGKLLHKAWHDLQETNLKILATEALLTRN